MAWRICVKRTTCFEKVLQTERSFLIMIEHKLFMIVFALISLSKCTIKRIMTSRNLNTYIKMIESLSRLVKFKVGDSLIDVNSMTITQFEFDIEWSYNCSTFFELRQFLIQHH